MLKFQRVFVFSVTILLSVQSIEAQWKQMGTSPQVDKKNLGVMHFQNGILWDAFQGIAYSTDTGMTWFTMSMPHGADLPGSDYNATDLSFFDSNNALVAIVNWGAFDPNDDNTWGGVYQTHDRGAHWQLILSPKYGKFYRAIYNQSPTEIHCLEYGGPHQPTYISNSLDGGITWQRIPVGFSSGIALTALRSGMLLTLSGFFDTDSLAHGYYSFDHGATWKELPTEIGIDSYSIDIDSCDVNRIYAANEDWYGRFRGYSTLYQSYDWGSTWGARLVIDTPGLSGSLASALHSVYAGTMRNGIYRSLDQGITWNPIGGPDNDADSRNLCAINDNIIFAVDGDGTIWGTMNSGGDSVHSIDNADVVPKVLFLSDSSSCSVPIERGLRLPHNGCALLSIRNWLFSGADSDSYHMIIQGSDSAFLSFTP